MKYHTCINPHLGVRRCFKVRGGSLEKLTSVCEKWIGPRFPWNTRHYCMYRPILIVVTLSSVTYLLSRQVADSKHYSMSPFRTTHIIPNSILNNVKES